MRTATSEGTYLSPPRRPRTSAFDTPAARALSSAEYRSLFRLDTIRIEARPNKKDSAEVVVGDEFIGVIFKDTEDGETTYHFEMAILDIDLPPASAVMKKP